MTHTTPEQLVACARGWLGTRFHHQGRLKKTATHPGGVDCLGLLVGIARELNLTGKDGRPLAALDDPSYAHYPDGKVLIAGLERVLTPVTMADTRTGDIALFRIDGTPRHLGMLSVSHSPQGGSDFTLIHAFAQARQVVEHPLDDVWMQRWVRCYRLV